MNLNYEVGLYAIFYTRTQLFFYIIRDHSTNEWDDLDGLRSVERSLKKGSSGAIGDTFAQQWDTLDK